MADDDGPSERALLLAIAALLARQFDVERENANSPSAEAVLSDAGLSYKDIALLVGKQPDAVRMNVTRARAKYKKQ
jgi:DNA-directed RNA polymerase specialized sigma24 family protein